MKSLVFSIILILTALAGLIINGYILVVIVLTKQIKSANHILLFHLGIVDISIGLLFLVFFVLGLNGKEWTPTGTPCTFYGFFFTLLQPLALWTICGLNFDRYYIIAVPLHYSRIITSKKVLTLICAVWVLSISLTVPPIFVDTPYIFIPRLGICEVEIKSRKETFWFSIVYAVFTLILPASFIVICNVKIFIIARYHRHRIASAIYQVAISAQVAITHQKNPFSLSFGRMATPPPHIAGPKFHSALYAMFQFVGSFMILYVPFYCAILVEVFFQLFGISGSTKNFYEKHLRSNFFTISSSLLLLTAPINGFLYGLKSKPLKQFLKNYWRKKQNKHDLDQEIQARTPSTCGSRRPSFLVKPENVIDVHKMMKSPFHSQSPSSNTLQVPSSNNQGVSLVTEDEIYYKLKATRKNSTYKFLHNIFGRGEQKIERPSQLYIPLSCSYENRENSPQILLTKANSRSVTSLDTSFSIEGNSAGFTPLLDNAEQKECSDKEMDDCED